MAILKNTNISGPSTRLPSGTTAERPTYPAKGMIRHNTSFNTLEYWNGSIWKYCPDIVRENLVLYYDPGEPSSYPGIGNVVNDLSSSSYNGTLTNGVTFDSANGGSFVFDGVNDYINTGVSLSEANNLFADSTNGISWIVNVWFKPDITTATDGVIVGRSGGTGASATFALYTNGTSLRVVIRGTANTITNNLSNVWYCANVGFNDNNGATEFMGNGIQISNLTVGTAALQTYNVTIGATNNGASNFFKGNIGPVKIYAGRPINRFGVYNFNAIKSRFGVS